MPNLLFHSSVPLLFVFPFVFRFCSEEGEKFNVWVAWLNLETAYGTQPSPEEAAMGLLRRALQYTDQKKMYLAALGTTHYDTS